MLCVNRFRCAQLLIVVALTLGLCARQAQGAITGINTPVTSSASITFIDTGSFDPLLTPGVTNTGPAVSPWNGSILTLPSTTDPITGDNAQGSIAATFAGNSYTLSLTNVTATQLPGNTGLADLQFNFNIEYQLDALGLPLQPTLYPNFLVNGTVQPGGFAQVSGFINYSGVNTAGTISVLETVNYNSLWNTPGPFTGTAVGLPVFGTTPALIGNTTLELNGFLHFIVDPATLNAQSVQAPEPGTLVLGGLGGMALLWVARRRAARGKV